jgi:outer membrane protein insertion porin family
MDYAFRFTREARPASRPILSLVVFLLVSLSSTSATPATGALQGASPLVSVEVTGSKRFSSEQIVAATGLHPGSGVTRDDLQTGADRLVRLGPFASVQYRFSTAGAGVKITYEVTDAAELPVAFDNFPWFSDDELTSALKSALPLFDGNAPSQGTMLDDISAAIQKLLETRNVHARVSHAIAIVGAASQQVQLFSAEGAELDVGAIEFSDALAKSDRGLEARASDLLGQPFSRSGIEIFELEQIRPLYLSHGFLQVRFGQPSVRLPSDSKAPNAKRIVITIPIEPGPTYIWNGITWKGNYTIPPDALDDLLKLKTDDLADGMKIEGGLQAVRDLYSERGYLDAKVDAVPKFDDAAKHVSYSVTVDEGPQYHMGNLVLTGLSLDGEKRIRSAWRIAPGAVFDKNAYDQFVDTGIKQAFAGSPFRYEKIGRFLQQNPHEAKVDVMLDFQ